MYCAAIKCHHSRYKNPDLTFFYFPNPRNKVGEEAKKIVDRCQKWWINTRRCDLDFKNNFKSILQFCLCEDHFDKDQFMCPADKGVPRKRKHLRKDAIPTLFTNQNAASESPATKRVLPIDDMVPRKRYELVKAQNNSGSSNVLGIFEKVDVDKQPPRSSLLEANKTSQFMMDAKGKDCLLCNDESSCELHQKKDEKVSKEQKSFLCHICKKILTSSWGLQQHLLIHLNCLLCSEESACKSHQKRNEKVSKEQMSFQCAVCSKILRSRWGLQQHLLAHSGVKEYKCQYCSKEFILKCDLKKHLKIHTGLKEYKCHLCTKEFILKADLNIHLRLHRREKEFKCYICKQEFFKKIHLTSHIKLHSEQQELEEKDCMLCSEKCPCELHRQKNEKESTEQKSFQCKVCNKLLRSKWGLQQHLLTHTGMKEFKCQICSKEFVFNYALTSHLKTHTICKEFKCQFCNKEFREKVVLKKHLGTHTGKKEYNCHICKKEFIQKINLQRHIKTHSEQNEFKCEICCKEFKDKWNMKKHVAAHSKDEGINFQLPLNQEHLNQHSQERELNCHICGDEFFNELYLQKHMLKHNDQQMIDVKSFSSSKDANMASLESDPDVDPLLIKNETPPVEEEVPDSTLSEETSSKFNRKDFTGDECLVKTEIDVDGEIFKKNICDSEDIVGDFIKVEEFYEYEHEVT